MYPGLSSVTEALGKSLKFMMVSRVSRLVSVQVWRGSSRVADTANIARVAVKNAGYTADGGMADYCIVPADYAVKVPDELDSASASSITCAGVTTYKAIKTSGVCPGQWLLIAGLGGLGNLDLQYAKNVFNAMDVNDKQLAFAKEMGADILVNPLKEDPAKVAQEKVGGVYIAVVTAVAKSAFNQAVDSVRAGDCFVGVGLPSETMDLSIPHLVLDGIEVVGSFVGTRQDLKKAFQFGAKGKVVPVCHMRPMEDINDIFEEMEQGKSKGRMVIDMTK